MKTAGFRIRVEPELRQAFVDACQANDQSATQVLRSFMRRYVEDIDFTRQGDLFVAEDSPRYRATKRKEATEGGRSGRNNNQK